MTEMKGLRGMPGEYGWHEGELDMQRKDGIVEDCFPDGTPISPWFSDREIPSLEEMGKAYRLDEYGILPGQEVQTEKIQNLIDCAAKEGGGVIVVPPGEVVSGALYFRQGVHLYIEKDGVLRGSSDICDYPLCQTRIEGQSCLYFPALINAISLSGFMMCGEGTIDGCGLPYWRSFWLRRAWNPGCTNKDEQRPRLVFLSACTDVLVAGLTFRNAAFWTNHLYKCSRVKYLGCRMLSPHEPVPAPSTDALDLDACHDVLISHCYMAVNDDAVALKGGKGPWADTAPENGSNERILIEDCEFGFCHGCLTLGSESIHNRNILMRRIQVSSGYNLLWMKFRPDTPQQYEYIRLSEITGKCANFLNINPWSQFFDLQGRTDLPVSTGHHVTIENCEFECDTFLNVREENDQYRLSDFDLHDLSIRAANVSVNGKMIHSLRLENVTLTRKETIDFPDSVTTVEENNTVFHNGLQT